MADIDDSLDARISFGCPVGVQAILRAAWRHDTDALKPLLDAPGKASCRDPETGETPLHAAIRSMGPKGEQEGDIEKDAAATKTVENLLFGGAIWNDVDTNNETPGCVAWRLNQKGLYDQLVRAGARAEMLFAILDGYQELESDGEEEEDEDEEMGEAETETGAEANDTNRHEEGAEVEEKAEKVTEEATAEPTADAIEETPYLESHLTLVDGKLVDAAGNGVMMDWETDIMRRSVDAMLSPADAEPAKEKRVLNIGFGLGIIDSMIAARQPARHHIIEAHPEVLARIDAASKNPEAAGDDHAAEFGAAWEAAGEEKSEGAHKVYRGRWQDICAKLLAEGELYDAIYFDTFGEDYSELRRFFTDYIPGLLDDNGVFGFFNGLGADRRVCYDVYTHVVEMHLSEAGLDVAWQDVEVPLTKDGLDTAGAGAWEGILRPYWTLEKYRLPICTFMG
ncbi:Arginine N-methyltransferase 2 [Sporothrix eucalyptigena]|uniref:Arginine N-methyltransferase 2 n=1 Tax=Sporothrix eucalyptigena TaxID=1812306 RepID=A0ABP0BI14_9PEZI